MPIDLLVIELQRLKDDYFKCPDLILKELILHDISLLSEALVLNETMFEECCKE